MLENDIEKMIEEGKNKKIKKEMLKSLYPTFKNPVDFVQYLEVDKIVELINNEMNNFTVQNHRKKKNIQYDVSQINNLTLIHKNLSK